MAEFVTVCKTSDLPPDGGKSVVVGRELIAVFNDRGTVCAITDVCPHMGASLASGELDAGGAHCRLALGPREYVRLRLEPGGDSVVLVVRAGTSVVAEADTLAFPAGPQTLTLASGQAAHLPVERTSEPETLQEGVRVRLLREVVADAVAPPTGLCRDESNKLAPLGGGHSTPALLTAPDFSGVRIEVDNRAKQETLAGARGSHQRGAIAGRNLESDCIAPARIGCSWPSASILMKSNRGTGLAAR